MAMRRVNSYVCDVKGCDTTAEVAQVNGKDSAPTSWGHITVKQIRQRSNVTLWLCPDHFQVIDGWEYA